MASRLKKTAHAEEQQRPDVLQQRRDWFASQLDLDPAKLVFVDETGASTNLAERMDAAGADSGCGARLARCRADVVRRI